MNEDYARMKENHPNLIELLNWLKETTGLRFTKTSGYRKGDNGVHGTWPCRGRDLRMRNHEIGAVICKHINDNWIYDPARLNKMCAILHGDGANLHIHTQVHQNTVRS